MAVDDDEWTDEEDNEKLVKKVNRIPLMDMKDVVQSVVPSLSFTARNGYSPRRETF